MPTLRSMCPNYRGKITCFAERFLLRREATEDTSQVKAAGRRRMTAATCRGEVRRQPDEDGQRRQGRGGGRVFRAKKAGDQRKTAAERPSRSARTPADGGPAGGGSAARGQRASTSAATQRRTLPRPTFRRARRKEQCDAACRCRWTRARPSRTPTVRQRQSGGACD
jgi:hypothetical protein